MRFGQQQLIKQDRDPTSGDNSTTLSLRELDLWQNTSSGVLFQLTDPSAGTWKQLVVVDGPVSEAALTDNSGGTSGGDTIAAVSDVATAANAIATLAAKVNSLRTVLVGGNMVE